MTETPKPIPCPCLTYAYTNSYEVACQLTTGHHPQCPALLGYQPSTFLLLDNLIATIRRRDHDLAVLEAHRELSEKVAETWLTTNEFLADAVRRPDAPKVRDYEEAD